MSQIQDKKENFRKDISDAKKNHSPEELIFCSEEVMSVLEITGVFQDAKTVFIYNSMPDEVQTRGLIERWQDSKEFYFPVVVDNNLVFRKYTTSTVFEESGYGIEEPLGIDFTDYRKVDLIIVPGVAFDRKMNRIGRGKGYYDRFLPKISAPKVGVCFDFQLFDQIPAELTDIKMDYLVSENELIWQ